MVPAGRRRADITTPQQPQQSPSGCRRRVGTDSRDAAAGANGGDGGAPGVQWRASPLLLLRAAAAPPPPLPQTSVSNRRHQT